MARWTIPFLALISLCASTGCSSYRALKPAANTTCQLSDVHRLPEGQYLMQIDIFNKHISGLMLFKETPTGTRAVFTNEMGFKFFDFEFGKDSARTVFILPRMNKKLIVQTFQNDLGMVAAPRKQADVLQGKEGIVLRSKQNDKDYLYHYTGADCNVITRIERGAKAKRKVVATIERDAQGKPNKAIIKHKAFNFKIKLTKVEAEQN